METVAPKVLKIFYCYARKDKPLRDEMDLHLSTLKRQNHVLTWADHEIAPGEDWARSIDNHINDADIIFLLVSPNFMGSDYCYGVEMRNALERNERGDARVIPIILRPVDWEDAPFSKLQALPTNAIPVTSWPDRDAAFADIVKNLRPMIKELRIRLKTKAEWLAEAEAFLQQDRHADALPALNQALALDPHFVPALIYRGGAYKQLSDYKNALADFEQVLSLDPRNATAFMLRGDTYRLQSDYTKALDDLNEALAVKPNYAIALVRRGETYRILGNYEQALADLDQALTLTPDDAFALSARGDTHRFLGNYQQALADLNHMLSFNTRDASTLTRRGETYRLMKEYKLALADFNEALRLNPTFNAAQARRGDTYRLLGDYAKALDDLNQTLARSPDDDWALVARAKTYRRRGQFAEALDDIDKAIALNENNDWYKYERAIIYFSLNRKIDYAQDLHTAIKLAQATASESPSLSLRWIMAFNIALYSLFLGNNETAQALYTNLVSVCILPACLQDAVDDLLELKQALQMASLQQQTTPPRSRVAGRLPDPVPPVSEDAVLVRKRQILEDATFQKELIDPIHQQIMKRLAEIEQIETRR